ncbi:MAG: hypothetical protein LBN36_08705 [Clostridiales Family XIII bacterium]|jgi:hypothetical protein|nr:hypothetical protein [Clostridiales Family XIII bacterium]
MRKVEKIGKILFLTVCLSVVLFASGISAFASSPGAPDPAKDLLVLTNLDDIQGDTHLQVQNVGFKLEFDGNVTAESVQGINAGAFIFTALAVADEETEVVGNIEIPVQVNFSPSDENYILVTVHPESGMLQPASDFELKIKGNLSAADGRTLGEDLVISVKTVDTSANTKIYMLLMVLMVGGMIAMTFISNKRKAKNAAESGQKEKVVNPYKLAKEKGISVQEALVIIEKDRQKREKRLAEAAAAKKKEELIAIEKSTHYRVKGARPASAGGSTYKTGRKALAEKKAKEEAARRAKGTTNPKGKNKGKSKK